MPIKKRFKNFLGRCFVAAGGFALGRHRHARRLIVPYYHRVVADNQPIDENLPGMFVRLGEFERQIQLLSRQYHPISAQQLLAAWQGQPLPKYPVLVTFDDGYRDNLTLALPILARYQVPWLLFVATGFIDNQLTPWHDTLFQLCLNRPEIVIEGRRLCCQGLTTTVGREIHRQLFRQLAAMAADEREVWLGAQLLANGLSRETLGAGLFCRWPELRAMPSSVTFGGHTRSHPFLSQLNEQQASAEIAPARERLADLLEQTINIFAYPSGRHQDFNDQTVTTLQRHEFACAFTTKYGLFDPCALSPDARFRLPRIGIDVYDSLAAFKMKIAGGWQWLAR